MKNLVDLLNKIFNCLSVNKELLNHSLKTAHLCVEIMQFLPPGYIKLSPAEMYLAGLLHDLGKITWPEEFFYKPKDKLSRMEIALMRQHPIESAVLAMKLFPDISQDVCFVIASHHERPDGNGYPGKIKITENESLLLATCDVFCACSEERQYRPYILAINDTIEIISEFAPVEIIEAISYKIRGNRAEQVTSMIK